MRRGGWVGGEARRVGRGCGEAGRAGARRAGVRRGGGDEVARTQAPSHQLRTLLLSFSPALKPSAPRPSLRYCQHSVSQSHLPVLGPQPLVNQRHHLLPPQPLTIRHPHLPLGPPAPPPPAHSPPPAQDPQPLNNQRPHLPPGPPAP